MKKNKKAFTLIELLVAIALTIILILGTLNINFNSQIDNQKALEFSNNIYTSIETVRNNSLLGKGIGTDLVFPKKWIINISNDSNSGTVVVKYSTGGVLNTYEILNMSSPKEIKEIKCYDIISKTNSGTINNIDIELTGPTMTLSGCTIGSSTGTILDIQTKYKTFNKTIRINTVTGMIEKVD